MKRYRFRLETLLRLRRAEEEQARLVLATTNMQATAVLFRRDREAERYRELALQGNGNDLLTLRSERQAAELAATRFENAQADLARALEAAAAAQAAWRTAFQRVSALERLEEKSRFAYDEDVRHEEIALIDDLVNARYMPTKIPRTFR